MDVPVTKVEHWFRKDDSFAIPDAEIWYSLKELLGIETDEFDEAITTFEVKPGVFEKAGRVYSSEFVGPTLTTQEQEKVLTIKEVKCVAMRGRGEPGHIEQNLEVRGDISNTLTSVEKDNLVMEIQKSDELNKWIWEINGTKYLIRIRKLTPRECWRLMTFSDEDFDKAAAVNSNTQLYKQAGNAIVKDVIADIIRQLL